MSTYINVTVGKAGLSDQAKRQTNANRQAKLEADARNKAEVDGKRQRDANRALQGIGPDGKPLYGVPPQTPARKDEPAAWRNPQGFTMGHTWLYQNTIYNNCAVGTGLVRSGRSNTRANTTEVLKLIADVTEFACANASAKTAVPLSSISAPALPTSGFSLAPTVSGIYYYDNTGSLPKWFGYAFGLRTVRSATANNGGYSRAWLPLPAGGENVAIIKLERLSAYAIDMTAYCGVSGLSLSNMSYTDGLANMSTLEAALASALTPYLQPGAALGATNSISYVEKLPGGSPIDQTVLDEPATFSLSYAASSRISKVYITNKSTIREITPSTTLQAWIDTVNPAIATSIATASLGTNVTSITVPNASSAIFDQVASAGNFNLTYWAPDIYESLNNIHQFIDPSQIKAIDAFKVYPAADSSDGAYADPSPYYQTTKPFYYAGGSYTDDPSVYKRSTKATLNLVPVNQRVAFESQPSLQMVTDWGEPNYCRTMLLAMGFRPEDLTP
jgi:hypothetical protein